MKSDKVSSLNFIAHFRSSGQDNQVLIEPNPPLETLKMACKQFCQWVKCPEAERVLERMVYPSRLFLYQQCIALLVWTSTNRTSPKTIQKTHVKCSGLCHINFLPYVEQQKAHGNESMVPHSEGKTYGAWFLFLFTTILLSGKIQYCANPSGLLPSRAIFIGR